MMKRFLLPAAILFLASCQAQLPLAPTPEVLTDERFNLFELNPEPLAANRFQTLFVTTREPDTRPSVYFGGREGDVIHMGVATVSIGQDNWIVDELIEKVTQGNTPERIEWTVEEARILADTPRTREDYTLSPPFRALINELNRLLAQRALKDLTIFVHGANNHFDFSVTQGAQYQFFTGNNAAVLTFSWPSPGNIWFYGKDKRRANRASADLAKLIELLARYSHVEKINLLGYSAGGRVIGRALAQLGEEYDDPGALRLGQVYLTQSDQPLKEFAEQLPGYFDLLEGLTVTAARGDGVLRVARLTDGQVRLGAAGDGHKALSPELRANVLEILAEPNMALIDITALPEANYKLTHGAWYNDPWVSTDVMVTLLTGRKASERALIAREVDDGVVWYFPDDYIESLKQRLLTERDS